MENIVFKNAEETAKKSDTDLLKSIQEKLKSGKPDFTDIAQSVGAVLADFTPKTLYQDSSKTNDNDMVLNFCERAFSPVNEKVGKYIEKKLQYVGRNTNYNREAFVPSASNSNVTVATLSTIRRDVDNLWVAQQLEIADPTDANMIQNRSDFEQNRYANILMGAGDQFPYDSFATQDVSIKTEYANWCLLGHTFVNKDGTTSVKPGLLTLISQASQLTAVSVNSIDLASSTPVHHVEYTQVDATNYDESRIEALAQLKQLIFKMTNPNNCFSYVAGLHQAAKFNDLVLVASNQTITAMLAANVNYFKELSTLFNPENVLMLPETTFDTSYKATGSTKQDAFAADVLTLSDPATGIQGGDIFIYEKELFQRFSNSPLETEEEYFKNARTITHWKNWRPSFDLLADRAYCLFSAPVLVNQYAFPVVDVKKTPEV